VRDISVVRESAHKNMASCVVVFGLLFLAVGFLASGVSFCAPYWLYNHNNFEDSGLWGHGYCGRRNDVSMNVGAGDSGLSFDVSIDNCQWRWAWESDWAWERSKLDHKWFVATQGLFGLGTVTLLFCFLIACANLCCSCGKERVAVLLTLGLLILFAVLLLAAGMVVFGVFAWIDWDASVHSSTYRYNWAFYLGIGAVFVNSFSALLYVTESCRVRNPAGYQRGVVV